LRKAIIILFLVLALVATVIPFCAAAAERVDIIIANGTIVTMDKSFRVIERGSVAVRGNTIVAVGPAAEIARDYFASRRLDARGRVVMPGLINTHTHVPMVLLRGIADDLSLMEWLQKYIFPAEAKNVDEEFVRWGTRLGCLEMIRGGITTFVDMYYFESAIADETARAGMRAVLGETLIDFPAPDNKTWEAGISYVRKFVEKWNGHTLITPAIAPHAPYTVSTEHLKQTRRMATELKVPLVIHVAEDASEIKTIQDKYGSTPVEYLDGIGFLDHNVIAAHMVFPSEKEIAILASRGVGVAHCPQSNMKVVAGVAPVPKMLKAGVAVGLGTDGAASNNDLNIWEEMDTAAKLHKLTWKDPTVLGARDVVEMATIGGARAIHLDKQIGSLEPGKLADLIVVGMSGAHQLPIYNVYSHLAYATKASDVEIAMINGRVVMSGRMIRTINEVKVLAKAREYRDRIRRSLEQ
jgi:5-methylthioadenosine/S-adenosylhomocysteine deaminase